MDRQATQRRQAPRMGAAAEGPAVAGPRQAHLSALAASLGIAAVAQRAESRGGLPPRLKAGVEAMSGLSMDNVRVHRNSAKPAQLNAHAYAQGTEIHLAPGQDHHLPHEAWHVVQQAQGRVRPTVQLRGRVAVNDDAALEREADVMGARAAVAQAHMAAPGRSAGGGSSIVQRVIILDTGDIKALRTALGSDPDAQILVTAWQKEQQSHHYASVEAAIADIRVFVQIKNNAKEIYAGNVRLIDSITAMHDMAQSRKGLRGYDTKRLETAIRLNRLAGKLRQDWSWDLGRIHQLVALDGQISQAIDSVLASFAPTAAYPFTPPPPAPLQIVDWGDDQISHLVGSKQRLASLNLQTRFDEIGVIRDTDNEQPISQRGNYYKGAIPYSFINGCRQGILDLVHQVDDSVALFSLERGGALLADHINDLRGMTVRAKPIPNVKVPKSAGMAHGVGPYNRTKHHLGLVAKMMETEEGQMFRRVRQDPEVLQHSPLITIAIAETAVSGSSVNTLLETLKQYHSLLPYSKFRVLVEKQTIKETRLHGKPLGGIRLQDPGINIDKTLTTDTVAKVQMFVSQVDYILGEDVGYQISYDHRLAGVPLVIFDESAHQLVAVKLSRNDMLPRDILRLVLRGAFDATLASAFR